MHIQACICKSFTHKDEGRIILNISVKKCRWLRGTEIVLLYLSKAGRNVAIKEEQPGWSIIPDVSQITLYFIIQSLFNLKAVVIVILE